MVRFKRARRGERLLLGHQAVLGRHLVEVVRDAQRRHHGAASSFCAGAHQAASMVFSQRTSWRARRRPVSRAQASSSP
jgi:hypothetical protein